VFKPAPSGMPEQPFVLVMGDAKEKIDDWRTYYNEARPDSALKSQAPAEYAR